MQRIKRKLRMAFFIAATYSNFLTIFADYAGWYRKKEMIVKTRAGARYKIRSHRVTRTDFYVLNESWLYNLHAGMVQRFVKDGATVIDVGAHIGAFTIYAALQAKNVKVYAFEPNDANYDLLSENIRLNHLEKNVIPIKKGLAGKAGEANLFVSTTDTGHHTFFPERLEMVHMKHTKETIEVTTLKNFFDHYHLASCDLMKIDCEGMEYDIIYNTPIDYLKRIKAFSIEHHWAPGQDYHELAAYLEKHGFTIAYPQDEFKDEFALIYAWQ